MKVYPETRHYFTHVVNMGATTLKKKGKGYIFATPAGRGDFQSGAGRCMIHLLPLTTVTLFVFLGTVVTLRQNKKIKSLLSRCIRTTRIDCECIYTGLKGILFPDWVNKEELNNRPLKFKNKTALKNHLETMAVFNDCLNICQPQRG